MKIDQLVIIKRIGLAISSTFGSKCEVVIHDLRGSLDNTIVFIENGSVSNRQLNDGPSYIVLKTLTDNSKVYEDKLNYIVKSKNRIFKCSTLFFYDDNNKLSIVLSINFDITKLVETQEVISEFVSSDVEEELDKFPTNVNDMLDRLIEQSIKMIGKPISEMSNKEKSQAIKYLGDCGAFLITKSTEKVANVFSISKFSIYNHIK